MHEVQNDRFKASETWPAILAEPTHTVTGSKLRVAPRPTPFVPPIFTTEDLSSLEKSEVILIRASAAVGKTTLARALSAERSIPILDLAKVPVATGSLGGILNDFQGALPAIQAFHAGTIPILVDALDEGRLNSGDNSLLSFIETSADLILQDRSTKVPQASYAGETRGYRICRTIFNGQRRSSNNTRRRFFRRGRCKGASPCLRTQGSAGTKGSQKRFIVPHSSQTCRRFSYYLFLKDRNSARACAIGVMDDSSRAKLCRICPRFGSNRLASSANRKFRRSTKSSGRGRYEQCLGRHRDSPRIYYPSRTRESM